VVASALDRGELPGRQGILPSQKSASSVPVGHHQYEACTSLTVVAAVIVRPSKRRPRLFWFSRAQGSPSPSIRRRSPCSERWVVAAGCEGACVSIVKVKG
jgi:hypothetical protein